MRIELNPDTVKDYFTKGKNFTTSYDSAGIRRYINIDSYKINSPDNIKFIFKGNQTFIDIKL